MKVIIELNQDVSIENIDGSDDQIQITLRIAGKTCSYGIVKIEDLKLALRKMTAK